MLTAWHLTNLKVWLHLLAIGPIYPAPELLMPHQPEIFTAQNTTADDLKECYSWERLMNRYATKMEVEKSAIRNISLYLFLDGWLGTPYLYAGKDKNGIDCSGFVSRLYEEVYRKDIFGSAASLQSVTTTVVKDDLKEGDLLFFNTRGTRISHVGVFLQNGFFVHASIYRGITINHLDETYYQRTFRKAGRVR